MTGSISSLVERRSVASAQLDRWITAAPPALSSWVSERYSRRRQYETAHRISQYDGCLYFDPHSGVAISAAGDVVAESLAYPETYRKLMVPPRGVRLTAKWRAQRVTGRVISLRNVYEEARHFHLVHEVICRLLLLESEGLLQGAKILLPRGVARKPFFQHFVAFRYAGRSGPLSFIDGGVGWIRATDALFCHAGYYDSCLYEDLARTFAPLRAGGRRAAGVTRLFVYRSPLESRSFVNVAELVSGARSVGLLPVDLVRLSPREQVQLFRDATWIVAEHGAALTNLVFCRSCCERVVEIFPPAYVPPTFYFMSSALGLPHRCEVAESVAGANSYASYRYPVDALASLV